MARLGRSRVAINSVGPEVGGGRFPVKAIVGCPITVTAVMVCDGQDAVAGALQWRLVNGLSGSESAWSESDLNPLDNDRWQGQFVPKELGRYEFRLVGWVDRFSTWRQGLAKKAEAKQAVAADIDIGVELIRQASAVLTEAENQKWLETWVRLLKEPGDLDAKIALALSPAVARMMKSGDPKLYPTVTDRTWPVVVDPPHAQFSAWYELFPRSTSPHADRPGTFRDMEEWLPYVAKMGFDVLYLPPIHPIGRTHRKGRNNQPHAQMGDPGSPWAIGSVEGGHKDINPDLGTRADFVRLVRQAEALGMRVALDLAFQCSPDHPYVTEHPEWFRRRPDGQIQYAENPPKKYEDIYPFDFECEDWQGLWTELKSIVEHWIGQGITVFRVDNPHTKPFGFWEWLITSVKAEHPEVLFLAEAFTRPAVMHHLAQLGFSQSYTYFAWRNGSQELRDYLNELTQSPVRYYFRPNFWPNTPDILTEYLQVGGRPAFLVRLILAATLSASYGIYGPSFELMEHQAREEGSEEYLNSEKYEIRYWDRDRPESLAPIIAHLNHIRQAHPALQTNDSLQFHAVDNDQLMVYSKEDRASDNLILVVVNMDPHHRQSGWVDLSLEALDIDPAAPFQVHDLLTNARYSWQGPRNYVELDPDAVPAHIFWVHRRFRTEHDFDYYF